MYSILSPRANLLLYRFVGFFFDFMTTAGSDPYLDTIVKQSVCNVHIKTCIDLVLRISSV